MKANRGEQTTSFDAFVSYSHALDGPIADGLVSGLHRFARPWYRVRALHVFRDASCLAANPLWPSIQAALDSSRALVLLASPEAAQSPWVARETGHWVANRSAAMLLIVATDGELVWDDGAGDFDWARTTALPPSLQGRFDAEPMFVDLRWARQVGVEARHDGRFTDAVATIAATLHRRPKDELVGEDVRRHRSVVRLARAIVAMLVTLAIAASLAAFVAVQQRNTAQDQRRLAISRQLGAQSTAALQSRGDRALLLAVEAMRTAPTVEARSALLAALDESFAIDRFLGGHEAEVDAIAVSADGLSIASGDTDGVVLVWRNIRRDREPERLEGHRAAIKVLAFTDEGVLISADVEGKVIRWGSHGTRLSSYDTGGDPLAFDEGGERLAVSRAGAGSVDVVATRDGASTGVAVPVPASVQYDPPPLPLSAAFEPDSTLLAVGGGDEIDLWDLAATADAPAATWTDGRSVSGLTFTADGAQIANATTDGQVCVRELSRDAEPVCRSTGGPGRGIAAGASGLLASAGSDDTVEFSEAADASDAYALYGHRAPLSSFAFLPDGERVVTGDTDGIVILYDLMTDDELVQSFAELEVPSSEAPSVWDTLPVAVDPSARLVAAATPTGLEIWQSARGDVHDATTWQLRTSLPLEMLAGAAVFTPDGQALITATPDGGVERWDLDDEPRPETIVERSEERPTYRLALAHDGDALVVGELIGDAAETPALTISVWDLGRDTRTAIIRSDAPGFPRLLPMDVAAATIAYATPDTVELADLETGEERASIAITTSVDGLALSPDGTLLATIAGRRVSLWDARSGEPVGELVGGQDELSAVAFSGDGSTLATGTTAGTVALWDVQSRRQLGPALVAFGEPMRFAAFGDDGSTLAGAAGGFLFTVDLDVASWIDRACGRANRDLTPEEWEQYLPDSTPHSIC